MSLRKDMAGGAVCALVALLSTFSVLAQNQGPRPSPPVGRMVDAVADLGAVGDDSADNARAFARAATWLNENGGYVFLPRGIYRTSAPIPTLTCKGCGFIGEGSGMAHTTQNSGPAGSTYGTVLRLDAKTGDTITIGTTAVGVTIRDLSFWPVPFKTAGYEIHDRGLSSVIENITWAYTYGGIKFGGGSNSPIARHLRGFAVWGPDCILTQGTSSNIADWAQAVIISDFACYQPWAVIEPDSTNTTVAWAAGTAYAAGKITAANGYIWQAVVGGTSAGSGTGPTIPAYAFAGAPTTVLVVDNDISWRMVQKQYSASVSVDGSSVAITIEKSQLLATYYGLWIRNALGLAATTGVSGTGSTATITFSGSHVFKVGATVTVAGVTPAGYNGNHTVTAASPGSVSFASSETGSYRAAGTVLAGLVPQYVKLTDSLVDHPVSDSVRLDAGYQNTITNTDLHYSALGRGVNIGAGYTGGLGIMAGHIWNNALEGIKVAGVANVDLTVLGVKINGNGLAASNTYSGIATSPGTSKFTIANNTIGPDSPSAGIQKYAVDIAVSNDNFIVGPNIAVGNGAGDYNNASGVGRNKTILPGSLSGSIAFTRDPAASSGDVSYTGLGFKPSSCMGGGAQAGGAYGTALGFADSSLGSRSINHAATSNVEAKFLVLGRGAANQAAVMKSYDDDGFTLTWTKRGLPDGGANNVIVTCQR